MTDQKPSTKSEHGITVGRRLLRLFFGLALLSLLAIGSFFTVIQLPVVQQWGISKLTQAISNKTNHAASIDRFYLTWQGELQMNNVYIEDIEGDTLLFAGTVGTKIIRDIRGLFTGHLEISDIFFGNTVFYLRHLKGGGTNINAFLRLFFQPKEKSKGAFYLNIKQIRLDQCRYIDDQQETGKRLDIQSGRAFLEVKCINFKPLEIEFGKIRCEGPVVAITSGKAPEDNMGEAEALQQRIKPLLDISFEEVNISNGRLVIHSQGKEASQDVDIGGIDYANMDVRDLFLKMRYFRMNELHQYYGEQVQLSGKEKSGFILDRLGIASAEVKRDGARLEGLRLETPNSTIGDSLFFQYSDYTDFLDFNNRVFLEGHFKESRIYVADLMYFVPKLENIDFFKQHRNLEISLEGIIGSRVNNLRGRDITLMIGDKFRFAGDFGSRNLAVPGEQSLNLKINDLTTSVGMLKQLIPGFRPPPAFQKLGKLRFNGRFDGFFVDFVSYGELTTDLGKAKLDMRMNVKNGAKFAEYSGNLGVKNFDLAKWTGDPDFGTLTFHSQVRNGKGLTIENLRAELKATVDSMSYRKYVYRNLNIDGLITKDRFDGQFDIRDEAVDFFFEGFIQYSDSLPLFDFRSIINRIDLHRLNFSTRPLQVAAILDFNLRGRDINALTGTARVVNLELELESGQRALADSVVLYLNQTSPEERIARLHSDIVDLELKGDFQILELGTIFLSRLGVHFPEIVDRRRIKVPSADSLKSKNVTFQLHDRRLDVFIGAFTNKMPEIDGAIIEGSLDLVTEETKLKGQLPSFVWKDLSINDILLDMEGKGSAMDIKLSTNGLLYDDKSLEAVNVRLQRIAEHYDFQIATDAFYPYGLNANGTFLLNELGYHVHLNNDSLVLVNQKWTIDPNNAIAVDSTALAIKSMLLTSSGNTVEFKDYKQKGIIMHLLDLDIAKLNDYLNYAPVQFGGKVNVDVLARDVFNFRDFALLIRSDDLLMNEDHYGKLYLAAAMPTIKSPLEIDFELDQLGEVLRTNGTWYPNELKDQGGRLDMLFSTEKFPISVAEYFLKGGIVNTRGQFDSEIHITGPLRKPEIDGYIDINGFETVIDYLGVQYAVDKGRILANSRLFDATGLILRDPLNNTAIVSGGLTHDHFRNLGLNCSIKSDHFMALNTVKQDNAHFYGTGIGQLDVQFSGSLAAANIYVRTTTARGSSLSIPVSQSGSQVQQQFIEFYTVQDTIGDDARKSRQVTGLQLEMDIALTEDALVQIIFDERTGDILRGYGRGNIRLEVPRTGSLKMFGNYTIERGDYLFTFQNLVNKSFAVERGGTIQWSGDPFDAQINMKAIYTIPSASVYNLIAEFLSTGSSTLEQAARTPTEVQLFMNMTGKLLQPDFAFDLGFPRLFGEVRSLVESKMQNLRRDPNDLNWQVFGLLVANNFLPPGLAGQGTEYVATINTVSEMISNQFSRYITALISEMVSDVGIISDVGFDFNYNVYQSHSITQVEEAFTDSKIQVTQRINFYDDRLSLAIEGSVINTRGIEASSGILIGGDFQVEYSLTEDRRLKMRVYQRSEPTILGNNRYKVGAGITYRKEFD